MSVFIRTTFEPTKVIEVSDAEYRGLLERGLVYAVEGDAPLPRPIFTEDQEAAFEIYREQYEAIAGRAEDSADRAETLAESFETSQFIRLVQAVKNPDLLIVGAVTRNGSGTITSAEVRWPDGTPGTFTTDVIDTSGAINAYHVTYGSPVTKTFTQPTMTRNAQGAVTVLPQIVVS